MNKSSRSPIAPRPVRSPRATKRRALAPTASNRSVERLPLTPKHRHAREKIAAPLEPVANKSKLRLSPQVLWGRRVVFNIIQVALGILVLAGLSYWLAHRFVITQTVCVISPGGIPCPSGLAAQVATLQGKPMLFYKLTSELASYRSSVLAFTGYSYRKYFPGTLEVTYNFDSPYYFLQDDGGTIYGFDHSGHYTPIRDATSSALIEVLAPAILVDLKNFTLDPTIHQKLYDLTFLSEGKRGQWQRLQLIDGKQLWLTQDNATYILDLFAIDENLQKLDFISASEYTPEENEVIDLRLNLPVVKQGTDSAQPVSNSTS